MYVVVAGNPVDGFGYHGTFATAEDASGWAENFPVPEDWWVASIEPIENVPLNSFYANWTPEQVRKMHMDLGKAHDDLGDANTEIRRLNTLLSAANSEVGRLLRQKAKVEVSLNDMQAERNAEVQRLLLAVNEISDVVHEALGSCNSE